MRNIDFQDETFDVVVFKSVLGAVGDKVAQDQSMLEIKRVLKKGGALLFAENAQGTRLHKWLRRKFIAWGERWRYISSKEFGEWSIQFNQSFLKYVGFFSLLGRTEKQRRILAFFDRFVIVMIPKSWRYVCFGVFIK